MIRELAITLYLIVVKIIFNICKLFPSRDRVAFVISFGDNASYIYEALQKRNYHQAAFLCTTEKSVSGLSYCPDAKILRFQNSRMMDWIRSIYWLATSRTVVLDNYYGFLAAIEFKSSTECIQIWHAAGAIKRFGIRDASVTNRSPRAQKRFLRVYEKFQKIVVGSEAMEKIFAEAFSLSGDIFIRTGIPRTDLFFDEEKQQLIKQQLLNQNPDLHHKKTILYAPTYRDDQLEHFEFKLDLKLLQEKLSNSYVVILKLHPALKQSMDFEKEYPGFVYDYSYYPDVNELLLIADYLISDYSSIPYEYSLLNKPMIFYPYDLKEYTEKRGLWDDYNQLVPGPIVTNTEDIVSVIECHSFDLNKLQRFKETWNEFHHGNSSAQLVEYLLQREKKQNMERARGN